MTLENVKAGDKVMLISGSGWGPRRYTTHEVEKVYKTGNLKVAGLDGQWRPNGNQTGRQSRFHFNRLEPYSEEIVSEILLEQKRADTQRFVRRVGEAMAKADEELACQVWAMLPDEVKSLGNAE